MNMKQLMTFRPGELSFYFSSLAANKYPDVFV